MILQVGLRPSLPWLLIGVPSACLFAVHRTFAVDLDPDIATFAPS
jgi:hypothetical protein